MQDGLIRKLTEFRQQPQEARATAYALLREFRAQIASKCIRRIYYTSARCFGSVLLDNNDIFEITSTGREQMWIPLVTSIIYL